MNQKIEISPKTILLTLGIIILLWTVYLIRQLILILLVAFIFFAALNPLVEKLVKKNIPRPLAIGLIVLGILLFFGLILAIGLTPFINQIGGLAEKLVQIIQDRGIFEFVNKETLERELQNLTREVIGFLFNLISNAVIIGSVVVFTVYFLLAREKYEKLINLLSQKGSRIGILFEKIEARLGAWVRGQFLLSLTVGILYLIALSALHISFALPLAIIGGILEVVPIVGPVIAWLLAALIALTISPFTAILVSLIYLIIQQIESNVIVPLFLGKIIGLDPLLVLLAIAVGQRLLGVGGVLLAVPITVIIQIVVEDYLTEGKGGFFFWLRS